MTSGLDMSSSDSHMIFPESESRRFIQFNLNPSCDLSVVFAVEVLAESPDVSLDVVAEDDVEDDPSTDSAVVLFMMMMIVDFRVYYFNCCNETFVEC